jgi:hypothetical protein
MDSTIGCLHDPAEKPFAEVSWVGVAVKIVDPGQQHVGVLFRDVREGGVVKMLDLQWHNTVVSKPAAPRHGYFWAEPSMDPARARALAGVCRKIARKYAAQPRSIGYALRYVGQRFDTAGVFMSDGGLGLTCATFVMAVFASSGNDLLTWHDWKPREEDRGWLQYVVTQLEEHRAEPEHVAAVREQAERGCARFRPEEVAAAGIACELPIGFAYAERIGKRIVARLSPPRRP